MAPPRAAPISKDDPTLIPSDDEDEDFHASSDDGGSDSSDSEAEGRSEKKRKIEVVEVVPTMSKTDVDDLWASFNEDPVPVSTTTATTRNDPQASGSGSGNTIQSAGSKGKERRKIKIEVKYEFVGETVIQEKEVYEDSEEAIQWRTTQSLLPTSSKPSSIPSLKGKEVSTSTQRAEEALFGSESSLSTPLDLVDGAKANEQKMLEPVPVFKPAGGPPKRARGGGLSALAAMGRPAKLNTLEKSKLDWNKFVTKEELSDDLTKARKDGYLEKQDFLQRTEDRREDKWDELKSGRRGR